MTASVLWIGPCFNLAAPAVVSVAPGDSSGWDGIGIAFDQSVATSRATLRRYPWALDIRAATRVKIGSLRISAAYNGIRCDGNCGGLAADLLEIGAFNRGFSSTVRRTSPISACSMPGRSTLPPHRP